MPVISDVLNDVEVITKRPDARARALLSINSIIQDICNNADYPEDLIEIVLPNPTPGSYQASISLVLTNSPPIRKIEYVVAAGLPLDNIKPRNALSNTGCVWRNAWYRSGTNLVLNVVAAFDSVQIGYYQQVGMLSETDTHWLLSCAYHMLVVAVSAAVFRATGDDTSGAEFEGQYKLLRQQFRRMLADSENI